MNITLAELKAKLAEVLRKAEGGEEIHVTKHGRPYLVLKVELPQARKLPKVGTADGQFKVPTLEEWERIPTGFEAYSG